MKSIFLILFTLLISVTLFSQLNSRNEVQKNVLLKSPIQNSASESYPGIHPELNHSYKYYYPGGQHFPDHMPVIVPMVNPYMKIKEPDTSVKYYMLIKDPYFANNSKSYPPLLIVNGEENKNGMKNINPKDIQHITVIKDKSAIEKYGKKGRNGIIEITTK